MTKQTRVTADSGGQSALTDPNSFVILPASALDPDEKNSGTQSEFEAIEDIREHLRRQGILTDIQTSIGPEAVDPREREPITLRTVLSGTLVLNDGAEYALQGLLNASLETGTGIRTSIAELLDRPCDLREYDGESWRPLAPYRGFTVDLDGASVTVGDVLDGTIDTGDSHTLGVDRDIWTGLLRVPGGHLATLNEVYEFTPIPGVPGSLTLGGLEENDAELVVGVPTAERTLRSIFDEGKFERPSGETLRVSEFSDVPMEHLGLSISLMEIFETPIELPSGEVVKPNELLEKIELEPVGERTVEKILHTPIYFDGGHSVTVKELLDTEHFVRSGSTEEPASTVLEEFVGWTAYENDAVHLGWRFDDSSEYEIEPTSNETSTIRDFLRDWLPVDDQEEAETLLTEFLETPVVLLEKAGSVQPAWIVPGVIDSAATDLTLRSAFEGFVVSEGGRQITGWDLLHRPVDMGTEPRTVEEILSLPLLVDDDEFTIKDLLEIPVDVEIRASSWISTAIETLLDAEVRPDRSQSISTPVPLSDDTSFEIIPWDAVALYYLGEEGASHDEDPAEILDRIVETPFSIGPDGYSIEPVSETDEHAHPGAVTLRTLFDWPVGRQNGSVVTAWGVLQSPLEVSDDSWTTLGRIFDAPLSVTESHQLTLRECFDQIASEELFHRYEIDSGALYLQNVFFAPFEVTNGAIVEGDLGRVERSVPERTLHDLMETPIDLGGTQKITFETIFELSIEVYHEEFVTIENIWIHDFRFGLRYTGAGLAELIAPLAEALKPAIVFGSDLISNNPELVLQTLLSVGDFLGRRRNRKSNAEKESTDTESDESLESSEAVSDQTADIEAVVVLGDQRIEYRGSSEGFAPFVAEVEPLLADARKEQ